MNAVLGISLSTRCMGIAVMRDGNLIESKVQTFPGMWSYEKLKSIGTFLDTYIEDNRIQAVAIKIPDVLPISVGYMQLVGALNVMFERKGVKTVYYTLSNLKQVHCRGQQAGQAGLAEWAIKKFPDLHLEYKKEHGNTNPYYSKVFEAVAAAYCLHYMGGKTLF